MGDFTKDLQTVVSPKFNETLLIQILQDTFGFKNVTVKEILFNSDRKKGDSYLSTVTRFTVKATGEDERNGETRDIEIPIISKALPKNIGHRKTFRSLDFFENEVIFYNKVWKAMNDFQHSKNAQGVFNDVPLCISALADGTNDYVTLEDLSFKGYKPAARCNGLDHTHTQLIMRLFAKFHALSLAFKDQQPEKFEEAASSLQETYFSEKFRDWYKTFQTKTLYAVVRDAIAKQLPVSYLDKLNELLETDLFGTLIQRCETRGPLAVVTHGDAWIPNFLLKYDDNQIPLTAVMLDFQLTRYASLANDITFFLYSCTEKWLWSKHWDSLIEDYHKTFTETLKQLGSKPELLTLDALKAEIKKCAVFGVGMSMEAIVMSMLEEDEVADLDMIKEDQDVPLESVWIVHPFKSEEKRQRMADMIKHAVDNGFI